MPRAKFRIVRHQKRIKGQIRISLPTCVLPALARMVELEAQKFGVSKSWVQARIDGEYFGYHVDHYDPQIAAKESKQKERG